MSENEGPVPQAYGPRQVFQWAGPSDDLTTVEVVGTVDATEYGGGHIVITISGDVARPRSIESDAPVSHEHRLDLDVTNARAMRDAFVAAIDWVCDNAENYS